MASKGLPTTCVGKASSVPGEYTQVKSGLRNPSEGRRGVEAEERKTEYCIPNRETAQPTLKPTPRILAARGTLHLPPD